MRKARVREKQHQERIFRQRKSYLDPDFLQKRNTKNNEYILARYNQTFRTLINSYSSPNKNMLDDNDYDNFKLSYFVRRRDAKLYWKRNLATAFLIRLYEKWKIHADNLNQNYYLKIWLFENDFTDSEIVVGLKKRIEDYNDLFEDTAIQKDIPFLSKDTLSALSKYNIEYKKYTGLYSLDDLNYIKSRTVLENCSVPPACEIYYKININKPISDNLNYFMENCFIEKIKLSFDPEPVYKIQLDGVWVIGR